LAEQVQREICALVDAVLAFDVRPWEGAPPERLETGLVRPVHGLAQQAMALLERIIARYESAEPVAAPGSREQLTDLCFMARMELRARAETLLRLGHAEDVLRVVDAAASVWRKVLATLVAAERALCSLAGLSSAMPHVHAQDVARSLAVRKAYASFRAAIHALPTPDPANLQGTLRRVGVCFAQLVGRDIYEHLRVHDRVHFTAQQTKVLQCLRGEHGENTQACFRLFQDVVAFAGMLVLVNNRTELREHDAALVDTWLPLLASAPERVVPAAALAALKPLHGRDDELDRLLRAGGAGTAGEFARVLERIRLELVTHPSSPPSAAGLSAV
jgi:hypothetical protein